ncbi:transposase, IS4 family [Phaeobacter porticola]|uniref:Transposase, IS4 family n=1 Tax=Phaeobacter porticola TaxID=1844006 RepID=A0A1L3I658_9RHOB|nr:transposase, IS4 family [Phaeobacter porticola]
MGPYEIQDQELAFVKHSTKAARIAFDWFDPEMVWVPLPSGKRGRQQQFSDAAIQTCLTLKMLFGMPLRQTTGFGESLLRLVGLDWAVPDFSTLCRRQKTLNVSLPYRGGTGPLNLLIDSTGIKAEGEGEWNARKHGGAKCRIWRKTPMGIDKVTLEVRAAEVTTSNVGDAPMLPELLAQMPRRDCCPWCRRRHSAPQERQTLKAHKRRGRCPERSGQRVARPGSRPVAAMERIPP